MLRSKPYIDGPDAPDEPLVWTKKQFTLESGKIVESELTLVAENDKFEFYQYTIPPVVFMAVCKFNSHLLYRASSEKELLEKVSGFVPV